MLRPCPKCGFEQPESTECARCGVVFAKLGDETGGFRHDLPTHIVPKVYVDDEPVADGRIGAAEWKILGFGLVAAVAIYALPFVRFIFSAIVTLFHELGHAVAAWLFGYPALPAFDLVYGGGITHYGEFHLSIAIAIGAGFCYLLYLFRENRKALVLIGSLFALWLLIVTAEWRREMVMASAGHLSELILAGIFFYKALAGVGWRSPEFERPLGAFIAFFVQINTMAFAWRLMHDPDFLEWYKEGKGGMLMNDLEQVALDLHIHGGPALGIEGAAKALFVFAFVPIAVALVWYFKRATWHRVLRSMTVVDA